MSGLTSIRTDGGKLEIVDQLLLPHTTTFIDINSVEDAYKAIKQMNIRGAPAIASLAALAFAQDLQRTIDSRSTPDCLSSPESLRLHVSSILDFLYTARPTAVNLGAATRRLTRLLNESIAAGKDPQSIAEALIAEAKLVADEDVGRNRAMSKHGAEWLVEQVKAEGGSGEDLNVLTVCNTGSLATSGYGTALGLITHLHETKKLGRAYFTQTAPYLQGARLTSHELLSLDIPCTMICDSMVGSLLQLRSIHAIAVGADRIARNGDTANKVGTYNAAVIVQRHKIPFIVVAPIATVDLATPSGSAIEIEQRPAIEACTVRGVSESGDRQVLMYAPRLLLEKDNAEVYNPAFDVTPAELITAIVTEKGVAVKGEGETEFDLRGIV